jgi:cholesterol transport system auxiliary component
MRTDAFNKPNAFASACSALCLLVAGCSALTPAAAPPPPAFYSLDATTSAGAAPVAARQSPPAGAPTLVVNETQAAAGFDSQRIIYVRQPHKLEYFAHNEWVDPPARMITPLIVGALETSGAFRAVVSAPGSASGELRLETEVLVLQQEFGMNPGGASPSRVRFGLRAYLSEEGTRRVVATRGFEAIMPAPSDDPYGGVRAANAAVQNVLQQLSAFCAESAAGWQPTVKSLRR